MNTNIVILAGTNRRGSNTRLIANHLAGVYAQLNMPASILDLADIPPSVFTPSAYDETPAGLKPFTDVILAASGLHVISPEYNGSFPGALKWFIDLLPFPEAFEGRPVAFIGIAAGEWGGLRPVEQLQMIFGYRNALQFPKRVFVRAVDDKLDGSGVFTDVDTSARLAAQASDFVKFVNRVKECV